MNIKDRIDFLQRYIIVHSYIYYELNNNVISDKDYDAKSKELVKYKNDYPELWKIVCIINSSMMIMTELPGSLYIMI